MAPHGVLQKAQTRGKNSLHICDSSAVLRGLILNIELELPSGAAARNSRVPKGQSFAAVDTSAFVLSGAIQ